MEEKNIDTTNRPLKYIIASIVCCVLSFLAMVARGVFVAETLKDVFKYICDGFFVGGFVLLGSGLLLWASNHGAFDMIGYGFHSLLRLFSPAKLDKQNDHYYEYREKKHQKKAEFLFLIIVGCGGILLSITAMVIYYIV